MPTDYNYISMLQHYVKLRFDYLSKGLSTHEIDKQFEIFQQEYEIMKKHKSIKDIINDL